MRRITTWLLSTVSALVLLFSYHTSTNAAGTTSIVAAGDTAANGSSGSGDPGTSTGSGSTTGSDDSGTTSDSGSSTDSGTSTDPGSSTGSGGDTSTSGSSSGTQTYTGDAVQTRYGPVQVEITVTDGTITKSVVTQVPWNDHRDQEINSYAVPILNDEAVQAQSASIDMVSGATFTSQGYLGSLQSAIDQAGL